MSNQRTGNWKPAAMQDGGRTSDMALVSFFKESKLALERSGKEDAAFYFEQVETWLREGKSLTTKRVEHILGL
jgi:hypothetical protein